MRHELEAMLAQGQGGAIVNMSSWALEVGYDYDDVFSQILICYVSSAAPAGLAQCPGVPGLIQQLSTYTNKSQYGNFDVMWTPIHRFTAHLGANLTGTSGSASPAESQCRLRTAKFEVAAALRRLRLSLRTKLDRGRLTGAITVITKTYALPQDVFAPRNFHGNTATLSLRYAF